MVIKLHGSPLSTCTRRAAVVFKECGLEYELVPVDMGTNEHKSAGYLEKYQPFGQIPVLVEEDGLQIYESRAIARYVAAKAGSALYPIKDIRKLGLFEQAASVEGSNFDPFASEITVEKVFKPVFFKIPGDDVKAAELTKKLDAKLQVYEKILGKQKYIAGDEVTLADLFHLSYGEMVFEKLPLGLLDGKPNVTRWWKDISSRPSWLAVKDGA